MNITYECAHCARVIYRTSYGTVCDGLDGNNPKKRSRVRCDRVKKPISNIVPIQANKQIITTSGAGVNDPEDRPTITSKFMNWQVKTIMKNVYEDMVRTVEIVRASGLDWTIVRVPMLMDHPMVGDIKVAWAGRGMEPQVTGSDLADFLVQHIEVQTYVSKAPAISIGKNPFRKRPTR